MLRQNLATNETFHKAYSTKNTSTHQHLQRNTTTAWYETRNDLTSTCDTNDQAKQCNSTRHVINKQTNQCRRRQSLATKPSHTPPFEIIRTKHQNDRGISWILSTGVGEAHLHTAVMERSQCSATGRWTLATQRQGSDRQGNWIRHCPHRSESWDARWRLSWVLRQLLATWDKAPSQMWKPCFLGHHLDQRFPTGVPFTIPRGAAS